MKQTLHQLCAGVGCFLVISTFVLFSAQNSAAQHVGGFSSPDPEPVGPDIVPNIC